MPVASFNPTGMNFSGMGGVGGSSIGSWDTKPTSMDLFNQMMPVHMAAWAAKNIGPSASELAAIQLQEAQMRDESQRFNKVFSIMANELGHSGGGEGGGGRRRRGQARGERPQSLGDTWGRGQGNQLLTALNEG